MEFTITQAQIPPNASVTVRAIGYSAKSAQGAFDRINRSANEPGGCPATHIIHEPLGTTSQFDPQGTSRTEERWLVVTMVWSGPPIAPVARA